MAPPQHSLPWPTRGSNQTLSSCGVNRLTTAPSRSVPSGLAQLNVLGSREPTFAQTRGLGAACRPVAALSFYGVALLALARLRRSSRIRGRESVPPASFFGGGGGDRGGHKQVRGPKPSRIGVTKLSGVSPQPLRGGRAHFRRRPASASAGLRDLLLPRRDLRQPWLHRSFVGE